MNNKQKILIFLLIFFSVAMANAQEKPITELKLKIRYVDGKGVEMRFFPDRKKTLEAGLKSGFIVERANIESLTFTEIGRTKPFTEDQWIQALKLATNNTSQENIEIAYDFYQNSLANNGGSIDFTNGISSLKHQKSNEDFEFMIFILTAIREPKAAQGLGLSYIDKTVEEGKTYKYRVLLQENIPFYELKSVADTIRATTNDNQYRNKVYTKVGDTELSFIWIEIPDLSGYDVERENQAGKFVQLNDAPIYTLSGKNYKGARRSGFHDQNLTNYQQYNYRFFGYNAFGERIQFARLTAMPRDLTPPQKPFLKTPKHVKPNEVLIEWEMQGNIDGDFKGFAISRSDENKGNFRLIYDKLLPKTARTFVDKTFEKGKTNYYLVQAIDTSNNISSSFPVAVTLIDTVPPAKPTFRSGKIDTLGIVSIHIKKNIEKDLMGYRLYRSNGEQHEFSAIEESFLSVDSMGSSVKTVFSDTVTLNSLTPYIYYKVEALDFNHNTSVFSDVLKVKRPDKIPPTTPVFKNVKVRETSVELTFALSRSSDVFAQKLYRKKNVKAPWEFIASLEKEQKVYQDKGLEKGQKYYYTIQAEDESGNLSEYAIVVMGQPYDNGLRDPVRNLMIEAEEKSVNLKWEYPLKDENTFFVIYKKNRKGNLVQYSNTIELNFKDTAQKGAVYAVKVFTKDGGQSKISNLIEFKD